MINPSITRCSLFFLTHLPAIWASFQQPLLQQDCAALALAEPTRLDSFVASLPTDDAKDLMVKLWERLDVVELMKMTGHGDGLDEMRSVQVAGEDSVRQYVCSNCQCDHIYNSSIAFQREKSFDSSRMESSSWM